jgi:energy-coupling factor transporter transmembrane protein EcfT
MLLAFLVGARIARLVLDVDDDSSGLDTITLQAIAIAMVTFAVTLTVFTVLTVLTVLTLTLSPVALFTGAPSACRGGAVDADVFVHGVWAQVGVAEAGAEAGAGNGAPPMMLSAGILHH